MLRTLITARPLSGTVSIRTFVTGEPSDRPPKDQEACIAHNGHVKEKRDVGAEVVGEDKLYPPRLHCVDFLDSLDDVDGLVVAEVIGAPDEVEGSGFSDGEVGLPSRHHELPVEEAVSLSVHGTQLNKDALCPGPSSRRCLILVRVSTGCDLSDNVRGYSARDKDGSDL